VTRTVLRGFARSLEVDISTFGSVYDTFERSGECFLHF
jgi:hypothetical protein